MARVTTFRRNSIARVASQGVGRLALFAWMTILARALQPAGFGVYTYLWTLIVLLGILSDFGLGFAVTRAVARDRTVAPRLLALSLQLRFLLGLCAYAILLTILVAGGIENIPLVPALVLGLMIFTVSGINGFNAVLNGREEIHLSSLMTALVPIATLATGVPLLLLKVSLLHAAIPSIVAGLFVLLLQAALFRRRSLSPAGGFEPARLRSLAWGAAPLFLMSVLTTLNVSLDTLLLKEMAGEAAVGFYNASYKVVLALTMLPLAIGEAAFPIWARALRGKAGGELPLGGVLRLVLLAALPCALVLFLAAPFGIRLVYGEAYAPAVPVLRIHAFTLALMFLNAPLGMRLVASDRMRAINAVFALVVALNAAANLVLIPRYGIEGAAVATLISEAVSAALLVSLVRRRTD